jgi:hypothetical protein
MHAFIIVIVIAIAIAIVIVIVIREKRTKRVAGTPHTHRDEIFFPKLFGVLLCLERLDPGLLCACVCLIVRVFFYDAIFDLFFFFGPGFV